MKRWCHSKSWFLSLFFASTMVCVEGSSWDRYEPAYGDQIGLAYAEPLSSEPAFLLPSSFKKTILNLINGEPYRVQLKVEGPIRPVSTHTKQVLNKLLVGLPHYRSFFFSPKASGQSDPLATPDLISYEVQVRSRFNDVYWIMIQNKGLDEWWIDTYPGAMIDAYITVFGIESTVGFQQSPCNIMASINGFVYTQKKNGGLILGKKSVAGADSAHHESTQSKESKTNCFLLEPNLTIATIEWWPGSALKSNPEANWDDAYL